VTGQIQGAPESDNFYVKPFWRKAWSPIGATVLYGEWAQYNNQFFGIAGSDLCAGGGAFNGGGPGSVSGGAFTSPVCNSFAAANGLFVSGSELERWGLGAVQEIDSAAMHVWARWQHLDASADFTGLNGNGQLEKVHGGFNDLDIFQAGGIIFF
jgi:hypothetical protein